MMTPLVSKQRDSTEFHVPTKSRDYSQKTGYFQYTVPTQKSWSHLNGLDLHHIPLLSVPVACQSIRNLTCRGGSLNSLGKERERQRKSVSPVLSAAPTAPPHFRSTRPRVPLVGKEAADTLEYMLDLLQNLTVRLASRIMESHPNSGG